MGRRSVDDHPLCSTLFKAFIADIEEQFKKGQAGGVVVGMKKLWKLSYAESEMIRNKSETNLVEHRIIFELNQKSKWTKGVFR